MFLRIKDKFLKTEEIREIEIIQCYKRQYYQDEYYKVVVKTKSDYEYTLFEANSKEKAEEFIEELLNMLNEKYINVETLRDAIDVFACMK